MFNRETTVRYVIHSEGYPLSTYLVIEATEADITRVDLYADGNLQMMIAEDIDFDRLPDGYGIRLAIRRHGSQIRREC